MYLLYIHYNWIPMMGWMTMRRMYHLKPMSHMKSIDYGYWTYLSHYYSCFAKAVCALNVISLETQGGWVHHGNRRGRRMSWSWSLAILQRLDWIQHPNISRAGKKDVLQHSLEAIARPQRPRGVRLLHLVAVDVGHLWRQYLGGSLIQQDHP